MAVHHDTGHSHDSGSGAAAAGWMLTTLLVAALVIALIVALFVWAPWSGGGTPVRDTGNEQSGDRDIDIRGDIDVNPNGQESGEDSGQ